MNHLIKKTGCNFIKQDFKKLSYKNLVVNNIFQ